MGKKPTGYSSGAGDGKYQVRMKEKPKTKAGKNPPKPGPNTYGGVSDR